MRGDESRRVPQSSAQAGLRRAAAGIAELGEGPVWDARHGALVWVDLSTGGILRLFPASGEEDSARTEGRTGAIVPRRNGGYVVAVESDLWCVSDDFSNVTLRARLPGVGAGHWINDARCDPRGRLWMSVAADGLRPGSGRLFRLDSDWSSTCMVDGMTLPNGLGWSPDGKAMYHVDSRRQVVLRYDFDLDKGVPSNPAPFIEIASAEGAPDGLSVDVEGHLWLAIWDAGILRRYSPAGTPVEQLVLPPSRVSSCAFGGADMRDLYVTTARVRLPMDVAERTLAGAVFVTRGTVPGLSVAPFDG